MNKSKWIIMEWICNVPLMFPHQFSYISPESQTINKRIRFINEN